MKKKLLTFLTILVLFITLFNINSCRTDFGFKEIDNLKLDSFFLEGSFAGPIINSELTLIDFIPDRENDSTFWAEVDDNNLVHLRMEYIDFLIFKMNEIYPPTPPLSYPAPAGTPIPALTKTVETDTSKMKAYDRLLSGKLFFEDPKITFTIENEIPVVTYFKMDTLTFFTFDTIPITHTDHTNYPVNAPSSLNEIATTTILIDTVAIPELDTIFSPVPRFISFFLTAGSENIQPLPFEVTGEEEMRVSVDIDLPLDVRLDTVVMGDTIALDWQDETYEQITSATLKIRITNGFPIDAYAQIYFADTTDAGKPGNILDSLFTDISHPSVSEKGWHLEPATTDAQGKIITSPRSYIKVTLTQEEIASLRQRHASKVIITGKLNSYNSHLGHFVKILGDYKMGIKMGIKADYAGSTTDIE